jgi:hypothetical protein
MSEYLSPDFLKLFIPLIGSIIAWFTNEYRKRVWEQYKRKERKYLNLISSLKGFYISTEPENAKILKQRFIDQLDMCWLYCPDDVIKKGYAFLSTVHIDAGNEISESKKELALGDFILAIRADLFGRRFLFIKRTSLLPEDFKIMKPN